MIKLKLLSIKIRFFIAFYAFLFFVVVLSMVGFLLLFVTDSEQRDLNFPQGNMNLSEEVLIHQAMMESFCLEYGVEEYVPLILAIMQVESGGLVEDVMQASESLGLPPNSLSTEDSIRQGCKYFSELVEQGERHGGVDLNTLIQSYNYGGAFIPYVVRQGLEWTFDLAVNFARERSGGIKVDYSNPIAVEVNGGWRYRYGNMFYVKLVSQYLAPRYFDDELLQALMEEALKYQGWSYVSGGSNPTTGFDCSGLTQWVFGTVGISLPRTAQEQFNATTPIPDSEARPGDLVFFEGTHPYARITHVGIYLGDGMMYDSNSTGVGYSRIDSGYWQQYFVGFGRVN